MARKQSFPTVQCVMAKGVIEKIKCDKCGYENEPQRIFCHECGAKLDRSEYVHEVEDARAREAKEAPKRLEDLRKKIPIFTVKRILIFGLGPLVLALAVLVFSPMDASPAQGTDAESDAAMDIGINLQTALDEGNPKVISTTQEIISSFLGRRLKKKDGTFWEKAMVTGWVLVKADQITLVTEREPAGFPMFFSAQYAVVKQDAGDALVPSAFYIGRLKLPASLAEKMVPSLMGDVAKVLKLKPEHAEKISKIELSDNGQAVLTVK